MEGKAHIMQISKHSIKPSLRTDKNIVKKIILEIKEVNQLEMKSIHPGKCCKNPLSKIIN